MRNIQYVHHTNSKLSRLTWLYGVLSVTLIASLFFTGVVSAGDISPELQAKIDAYKVKLAQWAQNPTVVKAVEQANSNTAKLTNEQWKSLPETDPKVLSFQQSEAGRLLTELQNDKSLGKLFLRDSKGNFVAGSKKPAIFNIGDRKAFTQAMSVGTWNSNKVKPDPTTKISSVQLSTPVMSNGKKIGVIHTSLNST